MKCPACNSQLKEFVVNNVTLDACNVGCGGLWFDNYELKKFDEAREPNVDIPMDIKKNIQRNPTPFSCPKCDNIKLFQHFSSVKRQVSVDECASCGGVWLDAGELNEIRKEFATEVDRQKAAEQMCSDLIKKAVFVKKTSN
jgi:Zn-finger nucleic acid-binding protein